MGDSAIPKEGGWALVLVVFFLGEGGGISETKVKI